VYYRVGLLPDRVWVVPLVAECAGELAAELGVLVGERLVALQCGSGYGFIDQIAVLEEMGRALLCAPYFSSVVLSQDRGRSLQCLEQGR
jgi:hypothetical protein